MNHSSVHYNISISYSVVHKLDKGASRTPVVSRIIKNNKGYLVSCFMSTPGLACKVGVISSLAHPFGRISPQAHIEKENVPRGTDYPE